MRTTAYTTQHGKRPRRVVTQRIRAALVARGSSLRAWSMGWAANRGMDGKAAYDLILKTLSRRLDRGLPEGAGLGGEMICDLRADLGADVVPQRMERAA